MLKASGLGDVFADGEVSIQSIIVQPATLEGINNPSGFSL
jgi:hypothetical protein